MTHVARRARTGVLVALLLAAVCACAPVLGPRGPDVVRDPPPAQVDYALRFGDLAPLPPGAHVVALRHQEQRDPAIMMAVRMPAEQVEPFLRASELGPFDPYSASGGPTVFGYWPPESAPSTDNTRSLTGEGWSVSRVATMETPEPGSALLHLWLITT